MVWLVWMLEIYAIRSHDTWLSRYGNDPHLWNERKITRPSLLTTLWCFTTIPHECLWLDGMSVTFYGLKKKRVVPLLTAKNLLAPLTKNLNLLSWELIKRKKSVDTLFYTFLNGPFSIRTIQNWDEKIRHEIKFFLLWPKGFRTKLPFSEIIDFDKTLMQRECNE